MIAHYRSARRAGLLALFILSVSAAGASVIEVDPQPDLVLDTPSESIPVDIDGDGVVDFVFFYDLFQNSPFLHVNVPVALQETNKVIVNGLRNDFGKDQILPLDSGATISSASLFNGPITGNGPLFAQPPAGGGDIMEGRGDNFIGLQFARNGAIHYGWFKVNVDSAGSIAIIKSYAWETTSMTPVTIGSNGIVRVERITVAGYSGVTGISTPGGTLLMEATIFPDNASNKRVEWSVNNPSIATIDSNGLLRAVRNGEVLVTATSVDNPGVSGSASVTITGQPTTSVRSSSIPSGVAIDFLSESRMLRVDLARSGRSPATVLVADVTGRLVATDRIDGIAGTYLLDMTALGSGTYLVLYRSNEGVMTERFTLTK